METDVETQELNQVDAAVAQEPGDVHELEGELGSDAAQLGTQPGFDVTSTPVPVLSRRVTRSLTRTPTIPRRVTRSLTRAMINESFFGMTITEEPTWVTMVQTHGESNPYI